MEEEFYVSNKEFDSNYLDEFRRSLWDITDEEELIKALPNSRFCGYIDFISYLKNYAEEESRSILEEIGCTTNINDLNYLKRELELSRKRIVLFSSKIEEEKIEEEKQLECDSSFSERKLIYLKSKAGNALVESDIDDITIESASDMKDAFEFLRNGNFSSDQTKYKTLSNHRNLKGIREVKAYQSRIYFYHLEKDVVLVILALVKKANNPKREMERLVKRAQFMYDNLDSIKENLNNPFLRDSLILEGKEISDRIEEKLTSKKVGGR